MFKCISIFLISFVILSSGCLEEGLIDCSSDIVLLGELHYPNGTSYYDENTRIYSMGNLNILHESDNDDFYLNEVFVSGRLENRSGNMYFLAEDIGEVELYQTKVLNKKLFLTVTNPLEKSLKNIFVKIRDRPSKKINQLYPGESSTLTWQFESCEDMQLSIPFEIKSESILEDQYVLESFENGGFLFLTGTIWIDSDECPRPAKLVTAVVNTKEVVTGREKFNIFVTVENIGDIAAKEIDTKLLLPPGLSTDESTVKRIDVLDAHKKKTISWEVIPDRTGSFGFNIVTIYGYEFSKAVGEIRSVEHEHEIEITLKNSSKNTTIFANKSMNAPEYLEENIFIENYGDVEDIINLEYISSDKGIKFGIYDDYKRILSKQITIAPKSKIELSLRIYKYPDYEIEKEEEISIFVWSEKDTTARDSVIINIRPNY